jgi:hypothetical protein
MEKIMCMQLCTSRNIFEFACGENIINYCFLIYVYPNASSFLKKE